MAEGKDLSEGRDEGRNEGRNEGRDGGRDAGRDEGRDKDRDKDRDRGHDEGHDKGDDERCNEGHEQDHLQAAVQAAVLEEAAHETPGKRRANAEDALPPPKRARLCSPPYSPNSPAPPHHGDVGLGDEENQPNNEANNNTTSNEAKFKDQTDNPDDGQAGGPDIKAEGKPLPEPVLEAQHLSKPTQPPLQHTPLTENDSTHRSIVEPWLRSVSPPAEDEAGFPAEVEAVSVSGYEDACDEVDVMSSASNVKQKAGSPKSSSSTTPKTGVDCADYRDDVLGKNLIQHCYLDDLLPDFLSGLVQHVEQGTSVPLLSEAALKADTAYELLETFMLESSVEAYLLPKVFRTDKPDDISFNAIQGVFRAPLKAAFVPTIHPVKKIVTPHPDGIFGYYKLTFRRHSFITSWNEFEASANSDKLLFPFLVFEAKGAHGYMTTAVNQCMGGAATLVNMVERLHAKLLGCGVEGLPPSMRAIFSVAANGYHSRIMITWKKGEEYLTQRLSTFDLLKPAEFVDFHRQVQNIFEWARTERLDVFRAALKRLEDAGYVTPEEVLELAVSTASAVSAPSRQPSRLSQVQNVSDVVETAKKRKTAPS